MPVLHTKEQAEYFYKTGRNIARYELADEDYLVCILCGEPWSLEHVCWQVQRRRAITLAYTVMKEQR